MPTDRDDQVKPTAITNFQAANTHAASALALELDELVSSLPAVRHQAGSMLKMAFELALSTEHSASEEQRQRLPSLIRYAMQHADRFAGMLRRIAVLQEQLGIVTPPQKEIHHEVLSFSQLQALFEAHQAFDRATDCFVSSYRAGNKLEERMALEQLPGCDAEAVRTGIALKGPFGIAK